MCEMLRWTVHLKGEPKRDDHAAVAVGHKVYSFGGYGQNMVQIEVHIFNTVSLRWLAPVTIGKGERPAEVPSRRYYHTAVLIGDAIYIWGGLRATESTDNVLYAFDVNAHKWFIPKVSGAIPDAKWGHSACALGKVIYIYGGYTQMIGCSNDICKLDTATMIWSLIVIKGPPAPASARHSATIIGTKMFVFGGGGQYNKIYIRVFDLVTNCWLSTPPTEVLPEGRRRHSAFSYNGELYIFGGHNLLLDYTFNDLWKFNPATFSWKRIDPKGKPSCWSYGMCCCMVGDRVIFFGGFTPNDLYILDLSPSLNTLCKLVVIEYKLDQALLPQDIKWELETMTSNSKCKNNTRTRLSVLTASQPT